MRSGALRGTTPPTVIPAFVRSTCEREKMTVKELIAENLDRLPEERLYEVLDFVEFLRWKTSECKDVEFTEDPLIGLFSGARDLSKRSEEILQEAVRDRSGLTWKE